MMLAEIMRKFGLDVNGKPLPGADPKIKPIAKTRPAMPARTEKKETQMEETKTRRAPTPNEDGSKTIGVLAPASTYARLSRLKERQSLASIKEAALVAIDAGLKALGV